MATLGDLKYDNLFSGDFHVVTDSVEVGENLSRGTVVGVVTSSGKAVAVDSSSADGSEEPFAVLADDVSADEEATVYLTGEFNSNSLAFGGSDAAEDHKQALRNLSIFLKDNA